MDDRVRRHMHERADGVRPDVDTHLAAVVERSSVDRRPRFGSFVQAAGAVILLLAVIPLVAALALRVGTPLLGGTIPSQTPTAADLVGSYSTTLPDAGDVHVQGLAGTWALEITPDGLILMTPPSTYPGGGQPLSGFSYTVTPQGLRTNLLIESCGSVGVYGWKRSGDGLTFIPAAEDCDLRRVLLTSQAWQLVR